MRVRRLMAAGIGLGACGGFVAGLLRSRPDPPWVGWQSAGEPPRYEPMASVGRVRQGTPAAARHHGGPRSTGAAAGAGAVETRSRVARPARSSRTEKPAPGH